MPNHEKDQSAERPQIGETNIAQAMDILRNWVDKRLAEKGAGIMVSRHEMLGVIQEEHNELILAVQKGTLQDVRNELVDIGVACIVALASLNTGEVEW